MSALAPRIQTTGVMRFQARMRRHEVDLQSNAPTAFTASGPSLLGVQPPTTHTHNSCSPGLRNILFEPPTSPAISEMSSPECATAETRSLSSGTEIPWRGSCRSKPKLVAPLLGSCSAHCVTASQAITRSPKTSMQSRHPTSPQ